MKPTTNIISIFFILRWVPIQDYHLAFLFLFFKFVLLHFAVFIFSERGEHAIIAWRKDAKQADHHHHHHHYHHHNHHMMSEVVSYLLLNLD
jgi:hypothetical protein